MATHPPTDTHLCLCLFTVFLTSDSISDSTVAETSTSTIMDNGENGKTNVSGSKFPTDLWLEVKEMVYRASHTVGTQNERVEIWHPPFGPFRLTFCATKKDAKSVTT